MSANLIIFDPQYISEQVKNLNNAQDLVEKALNDLKKASLHEGWKCSECNRIKDVLSNIKNKLFRLNRGICGTAEVLEKNMQIFQELEKTAEMQAQQLSNNLKVHCGFSAVNHSQGGYTKLFVTRVPFKPLFPNPTIINIFEPKVPPFTVPPRVPPFTVPPRVPPFTVPPIVPPYAPPMPPHIPSVINILIESGVIPPSQDHNPPEITGFIGVLGQMFKQYVHY